MPGITLGSLHGLYISFTPHIDPWGKCSYPCLHHAPSCKFTGEETEVNAFLETTRWLVWFQTRTLDPWTTQPSKKLGGRMATLWEPLRREPNSCLEAQRERTPTGPHRFWECTWEPHWLVLLSQRQRHLSSYGSILLKLNYHSRSPPVMPLAIPSCSMWTLYSTQTLLGPKMPNTLSSQFRALVCDMLPI